MKGLVYVKKIIPFNNILKFNTDVREITAISLEHKINKSSETISGVFYISGEYKITDGQVEREKFNFELPFDIALASSYVLGSLIVDIDDFRYNLISDKELKVNIDLYIDGEEVLVDDIRNVVVEENGVDVLLENDDKEKDDEVEKVDGIKEVIIKEEIVDNKVDVENEISEIERVDLFKEMLDIAKDDDLKVDNNDMSIKDNINNNLNNNDCEYVTYRVYKVLEGDTVDSILLKYNVTKDMLEDYNNLENICTGDKLIIPTNEE